MTNFDFETYISNALQCESAITMKKLSGGILNETIRATFDPAVEFCSHRFNSAVLKYTPPFLASSPDQPLSVNRQSVEAEALKFLGGRGDSSASQATHALLNTLPLLSIPQLIHHDDERNVLWISDLGVGKILSDYLCDDSDSSLSEIDEFSKHLGQFLAELYRVTRNPSDELLASFPSSHTSETYEFLKTLTQTALTQAKIADADELAMRVYQSLKDTRTPESCLGMVDIWPANFLVNPNGQCGLIDWEYFGLSSPSGELGMFREYTWVHSVV